MNSIQHPQEIPYGFCHCGCGQRTTIAHSTDKRSGCVKGQPYRFVVGHWLRTHFASPEERFWSRVDTSGGPDACWPWTGKVRGKSGYGALYVGDHVMGAHRYAYELAYGPLPPGYQACHNCPGGDNRLCCNPAHLFKGTNNDNIADKIAKGHQPHGTQMWNAKLTEDIVREIRQQFAAGGITKMDLAKRYGVCHRAIRSVIARKTWARVE